MYSERITTLKMVAYISRTTSNNLICTDLQEAVTNLILNEQAAALVAIHTADTRSPPLSGG